MASKSYNFPGVLSSIHKFPTNSWDFLQYPGKQIIKIHKNTIPDKISQDMLKILEFPRSFRNHPLKIHKFLGFFCSIQQKIFTRIPKVLRVSRKISQGGIKMHKNPGNCSTFKCAMREILGNYSILSAQCTKFLENTALLSAKSTKTLEITALLSAQCPKFLEITAFSSAQCTIRLRDFVSHCG